LPVDIKHIKVSFGDKVEIVKDHCVTVYATFSQNKIYVHNKL